jgi:hypothetical protein
MKRTPKSVKWKGEVEYEGPLIKEMWKALRIAEIAICNSVPVHPYKGDSPLVAIRKAMDRAEKHLANPSPASTTQQKDK